MRGDIVTDAAMVVTAAVIRETCQHLTAEERRAAFDRLYPTVLKILRQADRDQRRSDERVGVGQ